MFENTHTIFRGRNAYGGRGEFHGGDIEVFRGGDRGFFWGGDKVLRGKKTRVQSPESRVQGSVQLLGYAKINSWDKMKALQTKHVLECACQSSL